MVTFYLLVEVQSSGNATVPMQQHVQEKNVIGTLSYIALRCRRDLRTQ